MFVELSQRLECFSELDNPQKVKNILVFSGSDKTVANLVIIIVVAYFAPFFLFLYYIEFPYKLSPV